MDAGLVTFGLLFKDIHFTFPICNSLPKGNTVINISLTITFYYVSPSNNHEHKIYLSHQLLYNQLKIIFATP